jgi:subtilase family serine protease
VGRASSVRSRVAAVVALGTVASAALAATGPAAFAQPGRHVIQGSKPRWIATAKAAAAPAAAGEIHFGVLLRMRDQSGAEAALRAISDPAGAGYGGWLTSAQFRSRYAPAAADVRAVRSWLAGHGFATRATIGGMYVPATGSTALVDRVFGTTVRTYTVQGRTVQANSTELSLPADTPAAVSGVVAGVVGIDQGSTMTKPADPAPPPSEGFRAGHPCSAYYGQKTAGTVPPSNGRHQPYVVCGYTPEQYQRAYGVSGQLRRGVDGRGVTVAVTDAFASPTIEQDVRTYSRRHGLPAFRGDQFRQIVPPPDGFTNVERCGDWYGEETLDIEAVHAMAPGANVVYVGASDCFTLSDAWAQAIDDHVADVISNSWSMSIDDPTLLGPEVIAFFSQFALEAALTGITVNFSSGDAGDQTAGGTQPAARSVEFPSDLPVVTGVGGTSVGIDARGRRVWEHGWQNVYQELKDGAWGAPAYSSGGGGGTSVIFPQPWYQRGRVPAEISTYFGGAPMRAVPDISMPGDPNTGFLVGQTQSFPEGIHYDEYRIGGTSLSSPLLAGLDAVAAQKVGHPLGFANPLYYRLLDTPAVCDVTAPRRPLQQVRVNYVNSVDASGGLQYLLQTVDAQTSTIHSRPGYDDETGVGSPGGRFFAALPGRHHR